MPRLYSCLSIVPGDPHMSGQKERKIARGGQQLEAGVPPCQIIIFQQNYYITNALGTTQFVTLTSGRLPRLDRFEGAPLRAVAASGEVPDQESHIVQFNARRSPHNSQALD